MNRLLSIAALIISIPLVSFAYGTETALPAKENFHLYLLVGQSNMAGRGKVADEDKVANPKVLMLNKQGKWVPAVAPLHFDKPGIAGVGLGRTFGLEVSKANPNVTIGLIPCAVGGSPIASWEPDALDKATKTHPYDDMLKRANLALKSGTLKGILWHQGESDSGPGKADVYEKKLRELIARIRKQLDAEDVPFLIGQLGQFEGRPWNEYKKQVDQAQQEVAKTTDHCAFVPADGLTDKGDKTHFNSDSYREFGRRYAKTYLEMTATDR